MKDRNCRQCYAHYQKPTDYWCEFPYFEIVDGKPVFPDPVGFCEFCDRNNKTWYIPRGLKHKQ